MKQLAIFTLLLFAFTAGGCEDDADSEAVAQCKSACSVDYEAQLKYCSEKYPAGSDEKESCLDEASEEQSDCVRECEQ